MTTKHEAADDKAAYGKKQSMTLDGHEQWLVGRAEGGRFYPLYAVPTETEADTQIRGLEERDAAEAELQKDRNRRRDLLKKAGFEAAHRRGEPIIGDQVWGEQEIERRQAEQKAH